MSAGLTKGDRESLARLARQRAKMAKTDVDQRAKVMLLEVEETLARRFSAQDDMWKHATDAARAEIIRANRAIAEQCRLIGVPEDQSPRLQLGWQSRGGAFINNDERAEARRMAKIRVDTLAKTAKTEIERWLVGFEGELILDGLESDTARALVAAMPTSEALMPALSLADLGVKGWQPPEGAAAELLSTTASGPDLLRKRIARALEVEPGASNRRLGVILGIDHKTVGKYRPQQEIPSGERGNPQHRRGNPQHRKRRSPMSAQGDKEARPTGEGGGPGVLATGLGNIVGPAAVERRCAPWAVPSLVADHAARGLAAGRPISAETLDVLVYSDCAGER